MFSENNENINEEKNDEVMDTVPPFFMWKVLPSHSRKTVFGSQQVIKTCLPLMLFKI